MFKHKGVRIKVYHKNTTLDLFLCGGTLLFTALLFLFLKVRFETINNFYLQLESNMKEMLIYIFTSLTLSIAILVILKIIFKEFFYNLDNKKKLCNLILNNNFYSSEIIRSSNGKSRVKYTYFPKFYYSYKNGVIKVIIGLDGSRFQLKYLELEKLLEGMYNAELIDKTIKNSEVIYLLQVISDDKRIIFNEKNEECNLNTIIPLMNNLMWDITKVPHCLITGGTGGGKSYFLFYLVRSFLNLKNEVGDPISTTVKILDAKMSDLSFLESILPDDVFYDKNKILMQLRLAVEEMDRRYILMRDEKNRKVGSNFLEHNLEPYIIFFDEFIAFAVTLDKAKKEELRDRMFQIILKGRQAGVFLILTTQRADAEFIPGAIRDNLGLRVSVGNLSKEGYKMTFGDVEKEFLPRTKKGEGYIYLMGESKFPMEFYSPLLDTNYNLVEDVGGLLDRRKGTFQAEHRDNNPQATALDET